MYIIFLIIFTYTLLVVYEKSTYVCPPQKRLRGKTVIVTGGTAGIGLYIATDLARRDARVIVACPFKEEGEEALKYIIKNSGSEEVIFKPLDLSSLASVREFAEEIMRNEDRLDILVNNAGVFGPEEHVTQDGLSLTMQVNYFGHFLLTTLLLPLIEKSGNLTEPSRIINVTSRAHFCGRIDFEKMNNIKHWTSFQIYANSKLCVTLFTRELSKMLNMKKSNVVVNNADPGLVPTWILKSNNQVFKFVLYSLIKLSSINVLLFLKTPEQGARNAIYVALDDKAGEVSGETFLNGTLTRAAHMVYDKKLATRLWRESEKLVNIN